MEFCWRFNSLLNNKRKFLPFILLDINNGNRLTLEWLNDTDPSQRSFDSHLTDFYKNLKYAI